MITYRSFSAADADAVCVVAHTAWAYTYAEIFTPAFIAGYVGTHYTPERLCELLPLIEAGRMMFDVAIADNTVVGFCNLGVTKLGPELFRIYLLPKQIGQGIGAALLARSEAFVRAQGSDAYRCYVHKANLIGRRFYDRQGFQRLPEADHDDEWCLVKQLT